MDEMYYGPYVERWKWPVPDSSNVSSEFGWRYIRGERNWHTGIDISGNGKVGYPVVAACAGTVKSIRVRPENTWNSKVSSYGTIIYITHENGVETRYAHLNSVSVSEGQTVEAGQQIGTLGNSGYSSDPHLHFEVRVNGVETNPLRDSTGRAGYVTYGADSFIPVDYIPSNSNSSNDTSPSSSITPYNSELAATGYYGTVQAGGVTVGQRVAGLTSQPIHAFVNIWLGDRLLATDPVKPNMIQSFEYDRMYGAGETASFVLFDNDWEDIEHALVNYWDQVYIEYGYYGTGLKSKKVKHLLQNYSVSFESTGTNLTVSTITEGVYDNLKLVDLDLNTINPTEAVKKICDYLGYKTSSETLDASNDIADAAIEFNLDHDHPITYIQQVIIPQAASENEEIFSFWLEDNEENGKTAYFKRIDYRSSNTDTLRTYIYQKGYDSNVLDFTVDIKGVFGGSGTLNTNTGYEVSVFDSAKESIFIKQDKSSAVTQATGDGSHTRSDQSSVPANSSGYSPTQMSNILYYNLKSKVWDAYEATLTIVGDPSVEINTFIRVINVTDRGSLHHTSGVYFILDITDSIQSGSMVTTMKLVKNATAGDIDGIEILNPKYFIK